jgi:hypothetical protein
MQLGAPLMMVQKQQLLEQLVDAKHRLVAAGTCQERTMMTDGTIKENQRKMHSSLVLQLTQPELC